MPSTLSLPIYVQHQAYTASICMVSHHLIHKTNNCVFRHQFAAVVSLYQGSTPGVKRMKVSFKPS